MAANVLHLGPWLLRQGPYATTPVPPVPVCTPPKVKEEGYEVAHDGLLVTVSPTCMRHCLCA
jgi:hypothetical protein